MLESIFPSIESDIFHLGKLPFDILNKNKKSTRWFSKNIFDI